MFHVRLKGMRSVEPNAENSFKKKQYFTYKINQQLYFRYEGTKET